MPGHHGPMGGNTANFMAKNFKGTVKRLVRYLKPQAVALIFMLAFSAVGVVFTILSPYLAGLAINELQYAVQEARAVDMGRITDLVVLMLGAYVIGNGMSFGAGFLAASISQKIGYRMREELKVKLDVLPLKYFDGTTNGEILSRIINDVDQVTASLQQSVTQLVTGFFTIIGIMIIMFFINGWMALLAIAAIPLTLLLISGVAKRSQKQFILQQRELGFLDSQIEENYSGHNVVKLYGREQADIDAFEETNNKLATASMRAQMYSGTIMPFTKLVNNLTYVALCLLGGFLAISQGLPVGMIASFLEYDRKFTDPILQIGQIANVLQATVASAERVFEVLDEQEEIKDIDELTTEEAVKLLDRDNLLKTVQLTEEQERTLLANTGAADLLAVPTEAIADILTPEQITRLKTPASPDNVVGNVLFDSVDFSYLPDQELIEDMNLQIRPGENIAIVGPTGAGKTTMVNLLMRFYEIKGGSVDIDGTDVRQFTRKDLRGLYGMVLQDTWLFSGTIRDNIAYARPEATDEEVKAAAKKAHIHHFIKTLPDGYNTVLSEDASDISQGQRQLLTIARAILAERKILILDEATSSVDTRTEVYIQKAMSEMMEGKTSFVIAHRLSTIKNADIIIVMNKGHVIEHGNHKALMAKGGFYADLYNSQFNNAVS